MDEKIIGVLIILGFIVFILYTVNKAVRWSDHAKGIFSYLWSWLKSGAR